MLAVCRVRIPHSFLRFISIDNMQSSAFSRIQMLPFFQGISRDELLRMLECAKFDFVSTDEHECVVKQGQSASKLIYALSGTFQIERFFMDDLRVVEELTAPFVFHPECLFGASPTWRYTLTCASDAQLLVISKHDFLNHLMDFPTFRISMLNYLCRLIDDAPLPGEGNIKLTTRQSLIRYFQHIVATRQGQKSFHVGMQFLADCLSTSRLAVSRALRELQEEGLLSVGRKNILVYDFSKLLNTEVKPK